MSALPRGQPTKLTPLLRDAICENLRTGATKKSVANKAGISYQTFQNWLERGEAEGEGEFFDFFVAVRQVLGEVEVGHAATITLASRPHDVKVTTVRRVTRYRTTTSPDGTKVREPVLMEETTERTTRQFDWRAAEAWLRLRCGDEWHEQSQVDIGNAHGDPFLTAEMDRRITRLAALAEAEGDPGGDDRD